MSTAFKLVAKSGDYRHRKRLTGQLSAMSRVGLIAEFDFATFGTSTEMTDLSGNGNHADWSAAPTTSANGVTFDGKNADVDLSTDYPSGLGANRTFIFVCRNIPNAKYVCGDYNSTQELGCSVYSLAANGPLGVTGNFSGHYAYGAATESIGTSSWRALTVRIVDGLVRMKGTIKGKEDYVVSVRTEAASTRTLFRIGGAAQTVTGDDTVILSNPSSGEIAWCALWDRVITYNEEVAYLQDKILPAMGARSITLS